MRKKTAFKCVLLVFLVLAASLVIIHAGKVKHRNAELAEELIRMNKIGDQLQEKGTALKQNPKEIEIILQELEFSSYLKRLEIKKDHVQLQLDGVTQEQLFAFFKTLSEKTKHRLIQCSISRHGTDHLTLTAEIQLL